LKENLPNAYEEETEHKCYKEVVIDVSHPFQVYLAATSQ